MRSPKTLTFLALLLLFGAVASLAGNGAGNGGPPAGPPANPDPGAGVPVVDPTSFVTLQGPVVSFIGGLGSGMPTLVVDDAELGETAIRLGPFWFLTDLEFQVATGDLVSVIAFPCHFCTAPYAAVQVENLTTGLLLVLRDTSGFPLWIGDGGSGLGGHANHAPAAPPSRGGKPGFGPGPELQGLAHQGFCHSLRPDVGAAVTATGIVLSFTGGPDIGYPVLTLDVAGTELALLAGPYRVWLRSGFLPTEGQELSVTYAPADLPEGPQWVLLSLTDPATGLTLMFRDPETGLPIAGGRPW